jgi:N-acetylneuraminic acid mutarotase
MRERRSVAQAVTLQDGRVLVFGGSNTVPLATAELFDPNTASWRSTGKMSVARDYAVSALLPNGQVLAIGGATKGSSTSVTSTVELYDPGSGTWTRTGSMEVNRAYAIAVTLQDGSVLVAGGRDTYYGSGRVWNTAERWDPTSGSWQPAASMSTPRYYASAAILPDGSVLVAGGWPDTNGASLASASAEVFSPTAGAWRGVSAMATGRSVFALVALGNGQVLAVAGQVKGLDSNPTASTELFDSTSETWSDAGSLDSPVWYPAAAAISDHRAVVVGGARLGNGTKSIAEAEVFTPP